MENIYHPRRLTFIQVEDMCMFCDYPKGITLTYMVCPELLMGYISCPNCVSKAEEAIKIWNEQLSYGRLHYLKDKDISKYDDKGKIAASGKLDLDLFNHLQSLEYYKLYNELNDKLILNHLTMMSTQRNAE